jgi:hypothetical protein
MEKMSPQGLATAAFKILGKKESVSEDVTPEEKAELALKHAKETESLKDKQGREKETLMQQEDASGMNPKQKMKFDQLMKKLKGGKEHMKFKRTAKTPVQGDDMFHGYVKDLAMKEQAEIVEYTTVSPKMAKVFDSLKVGDKLAYKTKRYSSDGHKVTKKKMLRHNQLGWEQITLGKGVYLLKKEKTKEVLMKSGNMPVTIIDLVKESMNETVQVNEVQGSDYDFSPIQLSRLKKAYSTVKRIDPSSQNYKKLKKAISKLHPNTLEKIAREKIRFVSVIAAGEYEKKSGKRLHARDYMWFAESTVMEKAMTLGGTNAPSGETYMGDKGIQKMVALSKKNPNIEYTVKSDNYGDFKAHWLKNGKFAKRTVANINFDMDKNAVRGVPKGKTVKSTIFVLRYSVNEGVQMENDEYDNEGGMALQQLKVAKDAAMELCDIIKKDDNLPEWVQSKLTKAVDYMDSVRDYMSSKEGEEPVNEASAYADARRAFKRDDKKGLASLKKDTDDSATDSDRKSANKNIIMQMRKAADLPNGADVIFPSGKKKVDRRTAQQVLVKFNSLKKSFEKDKFQKSIRSLSDVKKMIGR